MESFTSHHQKVCHLHGILQSIYPLLILRIQIQGFPLSDKKSFWEALGTVRTTSSLQSKIQKLRLKYVEESEEFCQKEARRSRRNWDRETKLGIEWKALEHYWEKSREKVHILFILELSNLKLIKLILETILTSILNVISFPSPFLFYSHTLENLRLSLPVQRTFQPKRNCSSSGPCFQISM